MKTKTKFILFIALLVAISTFAFIEFNSSNQIEVGSFYVTKQYANSFELEEKPFYDTVQVVAVKDNSIKYVGWIGWEFVSHKKEFESSFTLCKECTHKRAVFVRVKYEDRQK